MKEEIPYITIQQSLTEATHHELDLHDVCILVDHLNYIINKNKEVNLTRIDDFEKGICLHIEDSLAALQELEGAVAGRMVDLGSGGGFPGIPLAVVSKREATLIDATAKKAQIIEGFLLAQGLDQYIEMIASRIEEVGKQRKDAYSVAVARALTGLPSMMELAAPLLIKGGILIAYKGSDYKDELDAAKRAQEDLGMEYAGKRDYQLSDGVSQRSLIVFKKTGEAKHQLPRRNGQAQKHPLYK